MDIEAEVRRKFRVQTTDVSPTVLLSRIRRKQATRDNLVELFGEVGFKYGAEIGVNTGGFSHKILNSIVGDNVGRFNGMLMLVDPWGPYDNCSVQRAEQHYQATLERLDKYKENIDVKRMPSMQAVEEVPDESLDFVYIDGLHDFNNAAMDIIKWVPKVRKGGIVSGHDYYHGPDFGVVQAVDSYTKCNHIDQWYITREGVPSFF